MTIRSQAPVAEPYGMNMLSQSGKLGLMSGNSPFMAVSQSKGG